MNVRPVERKINAKEHGDEVIVCEVLMEPTL